MVRSVCSSHPALVMVTTRLKAALFSHAAQFPALLLPVRVPGGEGGDLPVICCFRRVPREALLEDAFFFPSSP